MASTRRRSAGYLLLEDGRRFDGEAFYGSSSALGEAVFNTSHSGYQEILSDPSYRGQIMVFTAPHIGNVGVNDDDRESGAVQAVGAVVRALSPRPSSWRASEGLDAWMLEAGAPLLSGVDTRAVTLHIRSAGAMRAGLFAVDVDHESALAQVLASPSMEGADLASTASCSERYVVGPDAHRRGEGFRPLGSSGDGLGVAILDFGVKQSIIEELARRGCRVTVMPASSTAAEVLALDSIDGVVLSNGPGDPAAAAGPLETVTTLLEHSLSSGLPLFGICLGHQLLALAAGGETFKLPFGHRGANHPVRREADGRVEITSQNHGFAVKPEGFPASFHVTHINLNDGTVEGLAHREAPVFSIQYHPEASPGPLEGLTYFDDFVATMCARRGGA